MTSPLKKLSLSNPISSWNRKNWIIFSLLAFVSVSAGLGIMIFLERRSDLNVVLRSRHVDMNNNRIAIKGYDPVAYFTEHAAQKGRSDFRHSWNGAVWFFMNSQHRDMFASNPTRFAPQYGGFCASGISIGKAWKSDPEAWTIIAGKLYLATNKKFISQFEKNAGYKKADKNWENVIEPNRVGSSR